MMQERHAAFFEFVEKFVSGNQCLKRLPTALARVLDGSRSAAACFTHCLILS